LAAFKVTVWLPGSARVNVLDVSTTVVDIVPLIPVPERVMTHSLLGAGMLFLALRRHLIVTGAGVAWPEPNWITCPFCGATNTGEPIVGSDVHVTPLGGGGVYEKAKSTDCPPDVLNEGGSLAPLGLSLNVKVVLLHDAPR
jgi:hypothetical protein